MRIKLIAISVLILFFSVRLNAKEQSSVTLIFCDLTSVSYEYPALVSNLAEKTVRIIQSLPLGSHVYVFVIDSSTKATLVNEFEKLRPLRPSEELLCEEINDDNLCRVAEKIISLYDNVYSKSENQKKSLSCIVKTLALANDIFVQYRSERDYGGYEYNIVYLSDMMEECENSDYGPVSFRKDKYLYSGSNLDKFNPGFSLSYANVSVILTEAMPASDGYYITRDELRRVWAKILKKVGLSQQKINKLNFSVAIPVRYKKTR